ncbi:MAG: MBL fold metallo-hydrolase [Spirochaetaceae bacterium]
MTVTENKPAFTLWQLPEQTNSQMSSYVIRTAGNEVIVIDGGTKGDAAYLRKFIGGIGNHVHAWFISHPHLDHVDALTKILNDKSDITIDVIYASLPDDNWLKKNQDSHALRTQKTLKAALKKSGHKLMELSPSQKIEFQETTFEVLAVWNPELTFNAVNNQSAVWRVDGGGTSVLFLGDLGEEGGNKLLNSPYRNRLKADCVQMAHHGQTGVNEEFYKTVNPKFCLWATPAWLWENDSGKGRNSGPWKTLEVRAWMDKLDIEGHYISKDGLHRIDIPNNCEKPNVEQYTANDNIKEALKDV